MGTVRNLATFRCNLLREEAKDTGLGWPRAQECALKQDRTKGKASDQLMGADKGFGMKAGPISKEAERQKRLLLMLYDKPYETVMI